MKRLFLTVLAVSHIGLANADVILDAGDSVFIFDDSDKDSAMVKDYVNIAEIEKRGHERRQELNQLKDQLGLSELERMAVSSRRPPDYGVIKKQYRGADTDALFSLLKNENFSSFWHEIAKVIGAVGSEEGARKLASFLKSPLQFTEKTRRTYLSARKGGALGLGDRVARAGNPLAEGVSDFTLRSKPVDTRFR